MFIKKQQLKFASICAAALLCVSTLPSTTAFAANDLVMIFVDVQDAMQRSKAGQDIRKQLEEKQANFMKEVQAKEEELKKMEQELLRQRTVLSQEAFAERKKEFDNKLIEMNKVVQNQRQTLDKAFGSARDDMMKDVLDIIAAVKQEKKANVVMNAQQVVMSDNDMNATDEVLARLDKKVPSYKVKF